MSTKFKHLVGALRAATLPVAIAGGLLLFSGGARAADIPAASQQFLLAGESITADGSGYTATMAGDSLHIKVTTGTVEIQVADGQIINLGMGDEIVLTPFVKGSVSSIALDVLKGQATVRPTAGMAVGGDDGIVVETTVITPDSSSFSFATGSPDFDVMPSPLSFTVPSAEEPGGD